MKKNLMKVFAAALTISCLSVPLMSMAEAESDNNSIKTENVGNSEKQEYQNSVILNEDGKETVIEDAETIEKDGKLMFPVRAVAEAMGYEVNWDGENNIVALANMPLYVTFTIGVDGYTFARTAPMPIGKAPEIIDGKTYVPFELLTDIMQMDAKIDGTNIIISLEADDASDVEQSTEEVSEESTEKLDEIETDDNNSSNSEDKKEYNAEVKEIDNSSILVNDLEKGEVLLNIGEDAKVLNSKGDKIEISDIKEGDKLLIEYSEPMTMSLPPINNPVSITLVQK